jgi:PDZ domain-containing secreted protein
MKKFFYTSIFLIILSFNSFAQNQQQINNFLIQSFPQYMVDYVLKNSETVAVTEDYAKKNRKQNYQYTNLQGIGYNGSLRIGDTLIVFNDQAFYSNGQKLFMTPIVKQKVAKTHKEPKSPEEKERNREILVKVLNKVPQVLGEVLNKNNTQQTVSDNPTVRY